MTFIANELTIGRRLGEIIFVEKKIRTGKGIGNLLEAVLKRIRKADLPPCVTHQCPKESIVAEQ
jgi:hypothetical protein